MPADLGPNRRKHIRQIGHHFFSGAARPRVEKPKETKRAIRRIHLSGAPGNPWIIPFAANLALAAGEGGEAVRLLAWPSRLPSLAFLLGAPPMGLGVSFLGDDRGAFLRPRPGLEILSHETQAIAFPPPPGSWVFSLDEDPGHDAFLFLDDPRFPAEDTSLGERAYIIGLGCVPPPRAGIGGVWGRIEDGQILDPARPSRPVLLDGGQNVRRVYGGYLEALKRCCLDGGEAGDP